MFTQFHWTPKRKKAALALAEGQSRQAVADSTGVLSQNNLQLAMCNGIRRRG